ncbi:MULTISPECIES: ferric reductase-like transmembrane domain-containing protein [Thioalkalivibrio]|uniref:ferredoxin reductase family protein n=1 Tax=Thioalkalivibrio TaxID=106633 RepID=UPI000366EC7C|nr:MULTISPECIES: ferredoxin reductase family protein [Thioalkalivibrio]OOC48490.1 oxidoreductase [Thioalkalivibrio versutus]
MFRRIRAGDWIVVVLLLLPVLVAWPRWWPRPGAGAAEVLSALGHLAGVLGLSALLVGAMLSVRLPALDRWFGGLPRIWALHRILGFTAFILIMLHVVWLAFGALPISPAAAVRVIFPPLEHGAVWMGWGALALMVIFLAPTFQFFGRPHYQRWKRLHLLSVPAFLLAFAHAVMLVEHALLWWGLAALAVAAVLWRKVLSPRLGRHDYTVDAVTALASNVVEITLAPRGRAMSHAAGQFMYLTPHDPGLEAGRGEEHPYTISSAPGEDVVRVGIKALGDASRALQTVTPGTAVQIEGPYGQFFERCEPQRRQLWFGGGIGITPLVSGARALQREPGAGPEVTLIYLANRPDRAYYMDELREIAQGHPHFDAQIHYFQDRGPVDEAFIRSHCPDLEEREIYICGPPGMVHHLMGLLSRAGVPRGRIHTEAFDFL